MHWWRGIFRLWVLLTLIGYLYFVGFWLMNLRHAPWRTTNEGAALPIAELPKLPSYPQGWTIVLIAIGVPVIALCLGLVTGWVIAGFRTPDASRTFGKPPREGSQ